ncbi:MAG: O-antigen ligase family protein [Candidatus Binatia bacterium]
MERALDQRRDAVFLVATALAACLAGAVLAEGERLGYGWQAAAGLLAAMAVGLAWADERIGLALFGLSFLGVFHGALRLKVGDLWIPPPALIGGVLLTRVLVQGWSSSSWRRPPLPVASLFVLVTGLLASGLAALEAEPYASSLVKWGGHILVFAAVVTVFRKTSWIYNLTDGLSVVVAAFAVYGLYRVFTGASYYIDVFDDVATRAAASFYLTALLPLVYARLLAASGFSRVARAALLVLLGIAQVFTYNRAGWIASTSGLLFVTGRRVRWYVLLVLAAVLLVAMVPEEVRNRFLSIFIVTDFGVASPFASSTVGRGYLLRTGLHMVRSNWLLGVGLGNYLGHYYVYAVPGTPVAPHIPHNFYVYLWAEAGVVSLVGFLWFYGSRMRMLWQVRRRVSGTDRLTVVGFVASFLAMAIEAGAEDDLNLILVWTLLGMGTALAHLVHREMS